MTCAASTAGSTTRRRNATGRDGPRDRRAVLSRTYDLADLAEAHRYVDSGGKRGNVVVRIAADGREPAPSSTEESSEEPL